MLRVYIHTYIHTYMHAYIHTYIYTYIHTYIHTSFNLQCNLVPRSTGAVMIKLFLVIGYTQIQVPMHFIKLYEGVEVNLYSLLTPRLVT
jgi:hypothetical protein